MKNEAGGDVSNSEKDGGIIYTLQVDDSSVESDLRESESKIKKSSEKIEDAVEQSGRGVERAAKESVSKTTRTHEQGNRDIEKNHEDSGERRKDTEKKIGEAMSEIAESTCDQIGISFSKITEIAKSPVAAAAAGGAAIAGVGMAAVGTAVDIDSAMNQLQASTGATAEETEKYRQVMESVYKNNYGESFEDIGDAIAQVKKNLGEMDEASLENVIESAFALRDTFEYDIAESTRAAKAMMDNFGISGDEAMNLIAAGAQNGLDYSGELLDSISEYSVQFSKVGLDADDMFKIFQKGAETGAFNLDKVGDAVKEMTIRVVDGSDTTREGFGLIGLDADKMAAKFAAGGDSAKQAFKETINALAKIEDPLAQNTAGVDLFGTMWEDLGPEAVTALADIEDGAYDTAEAMEGIKETKYDDLASQFEGLKRNVEMLLVPLGEQLIPILSEIMEEVLPPLLEVLEPLLELVGALLEPLLTLVGELLGPLMEIVSSLLEPLIELIEACLDPLMELLDQLLEPLLELIETCIQPLLDLIIEMIEPFLQLISECLGPLTEVFAELFDPIFKLIKSALEPLLEVLQPVVDFITVMVIPVLEMLMGAFQSVFESISGCVMDKIEVIQGILDEFISFIQNVFTGNWEAAWENIKNIFSGIIDLFPGFLQDVIGSIGDVLGSMVDFIKNVFSGSWSDAWQNILDILHGIWDGITGIFKAPLNFIIDGWNSLADAIGGFEVPDWVPFVGGSSFSLPKFPRLKIGMDYVPSDFFPAYLDEGEAVLTKEENRLYRDMGGLQGMYSLSSLQDIGRESVDIPEIDYERWGAETAKALEGMGVYMDGEPVGRVVAPTVNDELGRIGRRKT